MSTKHEYYYIYILVYMWKHFNKFNNATQDISIVDTGTKQPLMFQNNNFTFKKKLCIRVIFVELQALSFLPRYIFGYNCSSSVVVSETRQ